MSPHERKQLNANRPRKITHIHLDGHGKIASWILVLI